MKFRRETQHPADDEENRLVEELKKQIVQVPDVPQTYFANLLVKTNYRIDEATSAKAISISWAARVAIPGVVAILFFFIGLHYYVPQTPTHESSVTSLVTSLPEDAVDSLLVEPERLDQSLSVRDVQADIFQFSSDQISEYLVATGYPQTAVESLSENEVAALLHALNTKKNAQRVNS
jgi:hypothetical protein